MTRPTRRTLSPLLAAAALLATSAVATQPQPNLPAPPPAPAPQPVAPDKPATPPPAPPDDRKIVTAQNAALADEITPQLDLSISRGFASLAQEQRPDGSFGGGRYGQSVAITSLSCLAYMADGNTPSRGQYSTQVRRGLEYVLNSGTETGLLAADSTNGPMYGHGFATLFLGEVYGMTAGGGDTALASRVHETLVKAVRLIEQTQNEEGGWRYNPVPYDADSSVTICQMMALRSARNAGLEVNKDVIDKAVAYIRSLQSPDGGFKYQISIGGSLWSRSAAAVATMFYSGVYKDEAIDRGIEYVKDNSFPGQQIRQLPHYFYGHYYAVQVMYLAGGDHWAKWWPAIREELIGKQQSDGSWPDPSVGPSYGTAMALIILQMPKRFLPIFQK